MRAEISKLHQKLNTTMIYVTHDQTEAMTMATRIVIMKDGIVQQVGAPKTVYNLSLIHILQSGGGEAHHSAGLFTRRSERDADPQTS